MAGPDEKTRKDLASKGKAIPGKGGDSTAGRFPIRNRADLLKAIKASGRAKGGDAGKAKVRAFIKKRARELNLSMLIPKDW